MTSIDRPRPTRADTREVAELRALKSRQPELAPAIDMQVELVDLYRRIQLRVSTPSPAPLRDREARLAGGCRVMELLEVPIDWADILNRDDLLDQNDHRRLVGVARDVADLARHVGAWYAETAQGPDTVVASTARPPMLDDLLSLGLKPFLARAAEVAQQSLSLDAWRRPWCPFCGAWPEFAVYQEDDQRRLICGRCLGRWAWDAIGCPWCGNGDSRLLPSFTSADRRYRVCACDKCQRYLKAYNARGATRPVLPEVDLIATLPLDAAASQRGYVGG
jgi:hypothetical protein